MEKNTDDIKKIVDEMRHLDFIKPDDIPSIDLYMDQVTTFMETHLEHNRRNDEDKIMTKTMINNYTKNNLLPPPDKKRYSTEHIILIIYIYYLKTMLSINDIQTFLQPMIDKSLNPGDEDISVKDNYRALYGHLHDNFDEITDSIKKIIDEAATLYNPEENDYLYKICVISLLSFDVYIKKKFIERLLDDMRDKQNAMMEEKQKKAEEAEKTKKAKEAAEKAKSKEAAEKAKASKAKAKESASDKGKPDKEKQVKSDN